jgi:hypothetical protein
MLRHSVGVNDSHDYQINETYIFWSMFCNKEARKDSLHSYPRQLLTSYSQISFY